MNRSIKRTHGLKGQPVVPGDKSISHRSLIFGAIADGKTSVSGLLVSEDVLSTEACLRELGVKIERSGSDAVIEGIGETGFKSPLKALDCGNSGTTMRVMMGLLAGSKVTSTLIGDASLQKRPMARVSVPLSEMGAEIQLTGGDKAPLTIKGRPLKASRHVLKVASAQVKSAILLAGLQAEGVTEITGEIQSRDHTERMLEHFGAKIEVSPERIALKGGQRLSGKTIRVPGDPSTAAFWMGAGSIVPNSEIILDNICLNPTRTGLIRVLKSMGAEIEWELTSHSPEPVGRITIRSASLKGVIVPEEEIPSMIDEIPLLAVLASQAIGVTEVSGAEELRVKESDRIEALASNLRAMGITIETRKDGFRIEGPQKLKGALIKTFLDHRIAMAFSIAGLVADGETIVEDAECVAVSYPTFFETLDELQENAGNEGARKAPV